MKQTKYLNAVLTIIAACLLVITAAITGLIPSANANTKTIGKFAQVPMNEDGSINVKILPSSTIDVNIESCDVGAFYPVEPLEVKIKQ